MANPELPWLNTSFLSNVLQSVDNNKKDVEIVKFDCTPALPPGNNYLSYLYRIKADYKSESDGIKSIHIIVKLPLHDGDVKKFVERNSGYMRELNIYNVVLPKMYQLHTVKITPESFFCPLESSLVLEDLKQDGYKIGERLKQLDLSHCRYFMKSLARLHALSAAAQQAHPGLMDNIGNHVVFQDQVSETEKQHLMNMSTNLLSALVMCIEKLEGCEKYANMIRNRINSFWENMVQLIRARKGFNVLNHGDPWTPNIMYKYNETGEVTDVKLIDFQLSFFGSFAPDIWYFWFSSANNEVRENHREELFETYRQTLNATLMEVNFPKTLSKDDFDQEMKEFAPYSMFSIVFILQFAMSDPDDLVDMTKEGISPDGFGKTSIDFRPQWKNFESKYFMEMLPNLLRQAEELGVFN